MSEHDEIDDLEGPRGLREHAKKLKTDLNAEKERAATLEAELTRYKRRDAFEAARVELPVELWDDLKVEDVADLTPEEITPASLTVRATERAAEREAMEAKLAEQYGMSVETFRESMAAKAAEIQQQKVDLAASAAIAAGGQAPTSPPPQTASERASEAFKRVKDSGGPDDEARAAWVRAKTEAAGAPTRGGRQ